MADTIILDSVDIGRWRPYQSYTNKEQIALQRNHLLFTGLNNDKGDISFIFTTDIRDLNEKISTMCSMVKIADTKTILEDEVYYTSKIEGANTTRKRTQELHNGALIDKNNEYSERMVKNSFDAVKLLNLYKNNLTQDYLLQVWNTLVNGACNNEDIRGNQQFPYRTGDVGVGSHNGMHFVEVEKAMSQWVAYYNSSTLDNYPFIKAALLHFAFETIHPFCDGNGRMGRLLINNYLISRGIHSAKAVSFSMQIDKRRSHYDVAFVDSENLYNDCTPFIEYMLEIMYGAYDMALELQTQQLNEDFDRD